MAGDELDMESFGRDLTGAFGRMFTFFPKSSGYVAMKDLGYLAQLDDPRLLEALAYLFDQVYVRHVVIADESDQNTFFYIRNFISMYWDIEGSGFIGDEDIARARIRNALRRLTTYSSWYVEFLGETVRPAIVAVLEIIESHQGDGV